MASTINVSNIEFDSVKQDIINFLQNQNEFSDFDFSGSAINTLIDVMAYTSHYMGVQSHMTFNEMFLDTAKLRSSVVSNAKELGYFPRQYNAASAVINVSYDWNQDNVGYPTGAPVSIIIPKRTEFSVNIDNKSYQFVTLDSYIMSDNGSGVYSTDIIIHQGQLLLQQWTYNSADTNQKFIIDNTQIDTSSLTMNVRLASGSPLLTTWSLADSIVPLSKDSTTYFLQETARRKVEIYFGDDVIGASPANNNIVEIEYLTTVGPVVNGTKTFSLTSPISGISVDKFVLTTVDSASGGAEQESLDSIRISAPLNYAAQNRAVVVSDYASLIKNKFGFITSLSVWGGEDHEPPQYGRVYVSTNPLISNRQKDDIIAYLNDYNIVGVQPIVLDHSKLKVTVSTDVEFYESKTTEFIGDIAAAVNTSIVDHFANNFVSFDSELVYSSLVGDINNSSSSIKGNLTNIKLLKEFIPITNNYDVATKRSDSSSVSLDFNNEIIPGSLISDKWTGLGSDMYHIQDDGLGKLWVYINDSKQTIFGSIGVVNYLTSVVEIINYVFIIDQNTTIKLRATPIKNNIIASRNLLLELDGAPIINVVGIK